MSSEQNDSHVSQDSAGMQGYSTETVATMCILVVTLLVGVPGNGLVLWVTSVKMKRTVNTVWFWNLAVADLTCCLSIPFSLSLLVLRGKWPYGSTFCKILPSVIILNMFASVFTLVAISIDRCVGVVKPVWAQNHRSVRLAWLVCTGIWLSSFLLCLPVFLYRESQTYNNITYCGYNYWQTDYYDEADWYETYNSIPYSSASNDPISQGTTGSYGQVTDPDMVSASSTGSLITTMETMPLVEGLYNSDRAMALPDSLHSTSDSSLAFTPGYDFPDFSLDRSPVTHNVITITRAVLGFFLPLVIISTCYVCLAWKLQGSRFAKEGRKTRKVATGIVLAFCICWVPYHIIGLSMLYSHTLEHLDHISQGLAFANSCVNPVLYVFMGKDFKRKVKQSLHGLMERAFSEDGTRSTNYSRSMDSTKVSTIV